MEVLRIPTYIIDKLRLRQILVMRLSLDVQKYDRLVYNEKVKIKIINRKGSQYQFNKKVKKENHEVKNINNKLEK